MDFYYVFLLDSRQIGSIEVLNDGKSFDCLESAQIYCNEYYLSNPKDMFDYFSLDIYVKNEDFKLKFV